MRDVRITGIIQASNEFPLILLSIAHALYYHLDDIVLLNHNTDDATISGIEKLKLLFPNRIKVINYSDESFFQEASTNILLEITNDSENHWAWVFDADEFLITENMCSLKKYVKKANGFNAIRLPFCNFVSTNQFNEYAMEDYLKLIYCSQPMIFNPISEKIISHDIKNGYLNYFDLPFSSKVIFQYNTLNWVSAGSHQLKYPLMQSIRDFKKNEIYAAHLPLLSYRRLWLKAKQGKKLIESGLPESHGWQSQMLYHIEKEGGMDEFWSAHSIHEGSDANINYSINYDLANSLKPICSLLKEAFGDHFEDEKQTIVAPDDFEFDFRMGTHVMRKFQMIADILVNHSNNRISRFYESEMTEGRSHQDEIERLSRKIEELNHIITKEREMRYTFLHSRSWLITKPLRDIFSKLRRNKTE
jgi:hypothetical protein